MLVVTGLTVTVAVVCALDPLLSVAPIVTVKLPAVAYEWVSDVTVPARLSTVDPSPQLTVIEDIVPSLSLAVKVVVTVEPTVAGFGDTVVTVIVGA